MKGRKPYPYEVMNATNDKNRLTKDELRQRKNNEPRPKTNDLKCPAHLSEEAKKEWHRIVKLYNELEKPIMYDLDCNALERYCNTIVTYRKAIRKVEETSEVYVNKSDLKPRKNPWLTIANEAANEARKLEEVLLLNPVSRGRVGIAKAKDPKELTGIALFLYKRDLKERGLLAEDWETPIPPPGEE